jgi:hypothetical protein
LEPFYAPLLSAPKTIRVVNGYTVRESVWVLVKCEKERERGKERRRRRREVL